MLVPSDSPGIVLPGYRLSPSGDGVPIGDFSIAGDSVGGILVDGFIKTGAPTGQDLLIWLGLNGANVGASRIEGDGTTYANLLIARLTSGGGAKFVGFQGEMLKTKSGAGARSWKCCTLVGGPAGTVQDIVGEFQDDATVINSFRVLGTNLDGSQITLYSWVIRLLGAPYAGNSNVGISAVGRP